MHSGMCVQAYALLSVCAAHTRQHTLTYANVSVLVCAFRYVCSSICIQVYAMQQRVCNSAYAFRYIVPEGIECSVSSPICIQVYAMQQRVCIQVYATVPCVCSCNTYTVAPTHAL
jgi:hypothetical protein